MKTDKIWQTVLGELEVSLSKANFTTWFKDTFLFDTDGKECIIGVPNSFTEEWLSRKYNDQVFLALQKLLPDLKKVKYQVISKEKAQKTVKSLPIVEKKKQEQKITVQSYSDSYKLEEKYTFDNFVVGNSNRLAYATAMAIAKNPGTKYNPLFLYGGVGLGKTHLMQAVGHELLKHNPSLKVLYIPCEEFTNEYVSSIQNRTTENFKKKYRNVDLLLVDDIQFLSGKEGTQEEFFHTFNKLHGGKRQIILSADRKPQDLSEIAGRLTSRFAWGMVADIMSPDLETRKAILAKKSVETDLVIDNEIIDYIAENIQSNIRELEGALNKVKTYAEIYQRPINLALVTEVLHENINTLRSRGLNCQKIIDTISRYYSVDKKDILGKRRYKELVLPRQIIMYLMRNELNYSFPKIGKEIGGKDHTTVIHGVEKIEKQIKRDMQLQNELAMIKEKLYI